MNVVVNVCIIPTSVEAFRKRIYSSWLQAILQNLGRKYKIYRPVPYRGGISENKKQTEEKAKVVAAVWGTEFIQFHAALQIYYQVDLNKRLQKEVMYTVYILYDMCSLSALLIVKFQ